MGGSDAYFQRFGFEKVSDNSFNENITPNRRKRKWPEN